MIRIIAYTVFLLLGCIGSQVVPVFTGSEGFKEVTGFLRLNTTVLLAFIMIHVGFEFNTGAEKLKQYWDDYLIAVLAALLPWAMVAAYFVYATYDGPDQTFEMWRDSMIKSRFAAATSAGLLLSMMAAVKLSGTWVFHKLKFLAIDIDTLLLMIPIKIMAEGEGWQLVVTIIFIASMLWIIWKHQDTVELPATWPWVLLYSIGLTGIVQYFYQLTSFIDQQSPLALEILLPAYALGSLMKPPKPRGMGRGEHAHHDHGFPVNDTIYTIIVSIFMIHVGLSLPPIYNPKNFNVQPEDRWEAVQHTYEALFNQEPVVIVPAPEQPDSSLKTEVAGGETPLFQFYEEDASYIDLASLDDFPDWEEILWHTLMVTLLATLGKMLPILFIRQASSWREKLAIGLGMTMRGEEGAGLYVISLKYGVSGPNLVVVALTMTLNLFMSWMVILAMRLLLWDRVRGGAHDTFDVGVPHPLLSELRQRARERAPVEDEILQPDRGMSRRAQDGPEQTETGTGQTRSQRKRKKRRRGKRR